MVTVFRAQDSDGLGSQESKQTPASTWVTWPPLPAGHELQARQAARGAEEHSRHRAHQQVSMCVQVALLTEGLPVS